MVFFFPRLVFFTLKLLLWLIWLRMVTIWNRAVLSYRNRIRCVGISSRKTQAEVVPGSLLFEKQRVERIRGQAADALEDIHGGGLEYVDRGPLRPM